MMLLDTNVVSELRKVGDGRADPNLVAWLSGRDAAQFYLSVISLMELEIGVLRIERRDATHGALLRRWLDERVKPAFAGRVLPIDSTIALRCATLHVPDPRSERDALIAATALEHAMSVVTRNVKDFAPTGVRLINPWELGPAG
ncbi:type II toxin-antitoxin system VapC family toxin [Oceanicaulis sp. LC35]|uniref:type II toxin-antitoxin system VapC family toxin n=1 Tax=Oceanicaulis sp. LC35 TaxID=3349635 RepID=UPI003F87ABA1